MIISHDIHNHTYLSRCGKDDATIENYIKNSKKNGLNVLGITDHLWDDTFDGWQSIHEGDNKDVLFYEGQNVEHVLQSRKVLEGLDTNGVKVLIGAEVEYDPNRRDIAITAENAEKFDYLIVPNSHTHMVMPHEYYSDKHKMIEFMKQAFMDVMDSPLRNRVVTMAHPFCAVCCPFGYEILLGMITDEEYKCCFGACADNSIAIEINLSKFRGYSTEQIIHSNLIRPFRIAKECGCKFTFGSDSHTMHHLDNFKDFYVVSELLELTENDMSPFVRQFTG